MVPLGLEEAALLPLFEDSGSTVIANDQGITALVEHQRAQNEAALLAVILHAANGLVADLVDGSRL